MDLNINKKLLLLSSLFLGGYRDRVRSLVPALAALSLVVALLTACAQVKPMQTLSGGQTGRIGFQTLTLTTKQFLIGVEKGNPFVIWGDLRLPRSGTGRLPAVILVHGSGGVGTREYLWAKKINKLGIATFVLDCFTGRGIIQTATKQRQVSSMAMIVDAYRALELLSSHPRVDPTRIALMGFSKGGIVALYASLKRFQHMHGPAGVEFVAYLPFYPFCNYTFIDENQVSDRPIRIFIGADDDYVPVPSCREYAEKLHQAGKDVQFTEYPGAHHGFDNPDWYSQRFLPQVQNLSGCFLVERPGGFVMNQETGQPFKYTDSCLYYGATIGYDSRAHGKAVKAVKAFLTSTFRLSP